MKDTTTIVLLSLTVGCTITRPGENGPQDMVLIGTPTYDNRVGISSEPVTLKMIEEMLPNVRVGLVTQDEDEGERWREILEDEGVSEEDRENLIVYPVKHSDLWMRDTGGLYVYLDRKIDETLAVVDFEFDGWGYGPRADDKTREFYEIDNQVAAQLGELMQIPVIYSPLIIEGGAIVANGEGTLIYSLPAATHRNPGWPQALIELELKRVLGAKKVIAMPIFHPADGMAVDDGPLELDGRFLHYPLTVRHVDEFISFIDPHTILVNQLPQEAVDNWIEQDVHDKMEAAWDFLEGVTAQDGKPFKLIAFPDPGLITGTMTGDDIVWQTIGALNGLKHYNPEGGEYILPASYMNYVVTNGLVLVPSFYAEGRNPRILETDAEAVRVLRTLYPGRKIVQIYTDAVVAGGGGMHCITQEIRSNE